MAQYFSKFERNSFLITVCAFDTVKAWAEDKRANLTEEERATMAAAVETFQSVYTGLINRLDTKYLKKILSDAKNYEVAVIAKRCEEESEKMAVKTEALETIAEFALWRNCQDGSCKNPDFKKCALCEALLNCGVPVANLNTDECPYKL